LCTAAAIPEGHPAEQGFDLLTDAPSSAGRKSYWARFHDDVTFYVTSWPGSAGA
jgi:hypothetical protein